MRLEEHERRYLEIGLVRKAEQISYSQLAERFEVSETTVTHAIRWCEENHVFEADQSVKLEYHIQDMRAKIRAMETELARALEANSKWYAATKGNQTRDPKYWIPIMKMIHTYQMSLMELEGLYKKLVNVTVNNSQTAVFVLPGKSKEESWHEYVEQFKNEHMKEAEPVDPEWERIAKEMGDGGSE